MSTIRHSDDLKHQETKTGGEGLLDCLLNNLDLIDVLVQSEVMNERMQLICSKRYREEDNQQEGTSTQEIAVPCHILRIPRIVKRDIRRRYLPMFCNVMNSYNFLLIESFFRKFCTRDVKLENGGRLGELTPYMELSGLDFIIDYHSAMLQTSPDKVTRALNIKIRQSSDFPGKTEIYGDFTVSHTSFYLTNPYHIAQKMQQVQAKDQKLNIEDELNLGEHSNQISYKFTPPPFDVLNRKPGTFGVADHFPRQALPQPFQVQGIISLLVNEDRMIEKIRCIPLTIGFVTPSGLQMPSNPSQFSSIPSP